MSAGLVCSITMKWNIKFPTSSCLSAVKVISRWKKFLKEAPGSGTQHSSTLLQEHTKLLSWPTIAFATVILAPLYLCVCLWRLPMTSCFSLNYLNCFYFNRFVGLIDKRSINFCYLHTVQFPRQWSRLVVSVILNSFALQTFSMFTVSCKRSGILTSKVMPSWNFCTFGKSQKPTRLTYIWLRVCFSLHALTALSEKW